MSTEHEHGLSAAFSAWLDLFRWAAALEVVFFHTNHRLFAKIAETPPSLRSIEFYLLSAASSFGHPSVLIFFVLSGYLVGGRTLDRYIKTGQFLPREYVASRLSRLWTVLIPSLPLVYVLNQVVATYFGGVVILDEDVAPLTGGLDVIGVGACNMAFMQLVLCPTFGNNGALWSLFHEFWYYVTFPMIMIAIWGNVKPERALALICTAALILFTLASNQSVGPNIAGYFGMWMLGVAVARVRTFVFPGGTVAASVLFVATLLAWRVFVPTGGATPTNLFSATTDWDFAVGLTFANLVISMKQSKSLLFPPFRHVHAYLAGFSFSLYCIHTPIINAYAAALVALAGSKPHKIPVSLLDYAWFGLCIVICVVSGWLFFLVTEKHTPFIRKRFIELLPSKLIIRPNPDVSRA